MIAVPLHLIEYTKFHIPKWCLSAIEAKFFYSEGVQYVIKN